MRIKQTELCSPANQDKKAHTKRFSLSIHSLFLPSHHTHVLEHQYA